MAALKRAPGKMVRQTEMGREIKKLVTSRRRDVLGLVRYFRKLAPGKQREFGTKVGYFVTLLELELKGSRKR